MARKALLGVWILLVAGSNVYSQYNPLNRYYQPGRSPMYKNPVSPYLNLVRPGASPAFNYYTLVRPELQFQQSMQGVQGELRSFEQSVITLQQPGQKGLVGLPPTGQPAGFMTHGSYFMNNGTGTFGTTARPFQK